MQICWTPWSCAFCPSATVSLRLEDPLQTTSVFHRNVDNCMRFHHQLNSQVHLWTTKLLQHMSEHQKTECVYAYTGVVRFSVPWECIAPQWERRMRPVHSRGGRDACAKLTTLQRSFPVVGHSLSVGATSCWASRLFAVFRAQPGFSTVFWRHPEGWNTRLRSKNSKEALRGLCHRPGCKANTPRAHRARNGLSGTQPIFLGHKCHTHG